MVWKRDTIPSLIIDYQFMIGRENKFLHGKMYFPGQGCSPITLESKDAHTVEKMRFGRIYDNKNMVEYYQVTITKKILIYF